MSGIHLTPLSVVLCTALTLFGCDESTGDGNTDLGTDGQSEDIAADQGGVDRSAEDQRSQDLGRQNDESSEEDVGGTDVVGTDAVSDQQASLDLAPIACADLPVCDSMEEQTAGSAPSGTWSIVAPNCSGDGSVTVDGAVAHSGSQSLRVDGGSGYCNHVFAESSTALQDLAGDVVYVRFWVRFEEALGMEHVTFLTMPESTQQKDLRMGGQSEVFSWNRESDDATLPSLSPTGIGLSTAPTPGEWTCMELMIDGSNGNLSASVGGTPVEGLISDGTPTADVDQAWLSQTVDWVPTVTALRIGWESYGSGSNTVWFDDLAISSQPIGCQ
ncbi:MAG: hypothetical protein KC561_05250 [Myxococcales bacterium]|nr:hypothetical protein [Myxococcales bacterium]